ncbi:MAG TPA: hypothetical protein VF510_09765 [Ktedonobacterales bacterium]
MWLGNTAPTLNAVMLLNALQQDDQQSGAKVARKGNLLAGILIFLCGALVLVVYLGVGVYVLWKAWQTGDWSNFWTSITPSALFFILPLVFVIPFSRLWTPYAKQQALLRGSSRGIRDALGLNDDRLMPPVPLQPAPLAPADLAAGPVRLGPLRPFVAIRPTANAATVAGVVLSLVLIFMFFPLFLTLSFDTDFGIFNFGFNFGGPSFFPFFPFALIVLFMIPSTLITLVARLRMRGKVLYVTVDALGTQWQRPAPAKGEVHIPWGRVRSISRIVYNGSYSGYGTYNYGASAYSTVGWGVTTAYVLEAPDAVLAWTAGSLSKPEEVAASEALLRTIVTRTGKPLCEMTGFATEIAQAGGNVSYILASRLPEAAPTAAFAPFMPGQQVKRRPRIWPWLVGAVVVLLFGSLYGGGAWAQSYQPTYFSNLPTRIHTQKPLFHDDLANPNGAWNEKPPDKYDLSGFAYAMGGYQLSGNQPGYTVMATYPYRQFGDAVAYEVTATQSGTMKNDSGDGVGIAFNSNWAQDDFMMFTVATTGDWQISHYKYVDDRPEDNWNYVTGGHSSAIHTGQGLTNQLLLVVRGHYFLVYINGQFIKSYDTRYDADLPTFGYAGVFLDDSMLVGTFKNLSVYPMRPATFPEWQYV